MQPIFVKPSFSLKIARLDVYVLCGGRFAWQSHAESSLPSPCLQCRVCFSHENFSYAFSFFFRLTTRLKNFWVDHHHHFVLPSDIKVMTSFPTF